MNEKIRGSLNTLASSLDLPVSSSGDGDLAARLNRLRYICVDVYLSILSFFLILTHFIYHQRNITKSAPAGTATISPPTTNSSEN